MRISDWSSDVCSSDLLRTTRQEYHGRIARALAAQGDVAPEVLAQHFAGAGAIPEAVRYRRPAGEEEDRKGVVKGKSVSVRVDLGGRRIIKKNRIHKIAM